MLTVENLHVFYGGIHALKGISFHVPQGKIVTLIGANGAGKSTTLRAIVGLVRPKAGSIRFAGQRLLDLPTHEIVQQGIVMVPEGRKIFVNLSVLDNLRMGAYTRKDESEIQHDIEWIFSLFPRLRERKFQKAGTLSGGEQQMLAVGRALMSRPKLLMMDEPSLGLAPLLVKEIFQIIRRIHEEGTTILLIEQNARAALSIADYGYVLETGRIILDGPGKTLLENVDVKKAYLGE
ncbi:MAG: ABC transporter ATP-binding protein [Nitrospinota bacterium]|nr:MAG: ABC transporter ATP-binding protein [Nitrospinota bacterium]